MRADSMNQFTDFEFVVRFKMIIDIDFKFFRFISQISLDLSRWNADWLLAFEMISFEIRIFDEDINQSFVKSIKI